MLLSKTVVALLAGLVAAQDGMPPPQGHAAATLETDLPLVGRRGGDGHALALPPEDFADADLYVEGAGAKARLRGAESGTEKGDGTCFTDDDCESKVCGWDFKCGEKLTNGDLCGEDDDCESGVCSFFKCKEKGDGTCFTDDDCESKVCGWDFKCGEKLPNGDWCGEDDDCESGNCSFFKCKEK